MGTRLVISLLLLMGHSVAHATSFTVTNTADSGGGSLRDAIEASNRGGSNSITFTATGTIALATPLPPLMNTLTIAGPGADKLTIQGSPDAMPVLTSGGSLQLSGVTITGAANTGNNGGGILVTDGSLVVRNCTITGNTAAFGGGIYSMKGEISVLTSTISGNTGTGAIFGGGDITVVDSTIADNTGTAIVSQGADAILSVNRTTISGNAGGSGVGGIQLQAGIARIRNTTFSGNTGLQAGDFWTFSDTVTLTLTNVTAVGGSAPALLFDHDAIVMLRNTVLAGTGARCAGAHLPTSLGHNLSSDTTCNLTQTTDKPGIDPMLGPLAANGGPTRTYAPLAGSPVLNAGDGTGLEANDQRGAARVQFAVVDVGAVEVSEPMVMTQPAPQTVAEGDMFTLSVAAMNQNSTSPLKYQWRKDGAAIAGATSATYTNPAAAVEDAGMYDVLVINDGGSVPSMAVAVAVTPLTKREDSSGGCCSATSRAGWPDAVVGLGLALFLGVPRRRRAPRR